MANELIDGSMVVLAALQILNERLSQIGLKRYLANSSQGYKMSDTVRIRRAPQFPLGALIGSTFTVRSDLVLLDSRITCHLDLPDTDLFLSIDRFTERHLDSNMGKMAMIMTQSTPETHAAVIAEQGITPGMEWSHRMHHPKDNTALRLARWYDLERDQKFTVIDVLFGCCPAD